MTFKLADRVKETTTTAGISNVVLGGAYDGYQTFADAIGNGHKTYYVIVDQGNNNWEVGVGTYHSTGNILSRDTVLESSNSDDKISLTGGVSDVFVSYPAEKVVCLNPDSYVSGVAFSGYAFPDGSTQTSAAVEISDTSNLPNAIAIWSDSSALTKNAGFQFITDKFVNNHPTEMNVLSGIPLTITRYASGNFFEAYIDNTNDRTLALNLTNEASPTWKLGLKNDPSNNLAPEYGYTYGSNGSAGQAATSDTYTTINYSNGLWFTHKSSNLFNFDKTNGGIIYNATASAPALTVKGAAAQSANLQEWKNVSDTVVAYLEPDGSISGNAFRVSGIIFPDGTTQSTTAADGAFSVASGVIQLGLINTNISNIATNTNNIVASGTTIIDSSTALTIASGTAIRSEVASNTSSIGGNTGSITVNRDNIVASGTAIINSYTDLVIASGTAERADTVASGTSIIGQFSSKANLNSPAFAGTPTAPTAAALTNTTQIATTAFVRTEVTNLVDSAPGALDTLNELAAAINDDASFSTTVTNSIATKASLTTLAGASGALQKDIDLVYASGDAVSGIAFGAYAWGNHASVGYGTPTDLGLLYASGSDTSGIAFAAYARGDHRELGLVTHATFGSQGLIKRGSTSGTYTFITDNSSNWNTAYGWGDHGSEGYLTAETFALNSGTAERSATIQSGQAILDLGIVRHNDFDAHGFMKRGATSGVYTIVTDNSANWNTAYGWGDHGSAGYLTAATFINGSGTSERAATIASGTKLRKDIDLVFASGSDTSGIAFGAYAWGNHGSAGYLTTATFINGSGTAERAATIASGTAIRSEIKTYTATSGLELHGATAFAVGISGDNLLSTNDPVDNYVPSFDLSSRQFTWVENAGGGGGGGSVTTVKANGSQVGGADIVTLDFSSDFGVAETPDTEINITIGTLNQDTTGSAATLTTARNINGVAFDGSANITVPAAGTTLSDTVPVSKGGTGATALADKAVLITQDSGTDTVSAAVMDANGELLIGGTDGPAGATLTQGSNVTITNGNGTIEIASTQLTTEEVQDIVGAMVGSNTESGITVAYQDADGTLDFTVGTLNQDTAGTAAIATTVTVADESSDTTCFPLFVTTATGDQAPKSGSNLTFNSDTGLLTATSLGGTLTTAAQANVTSLGTLTTLTVDNVIINGTTIGHTDDTDLITLADGVVTVAGEISVTTLDIGGTNVTSTAAELNILDGVTSTAAELNILDGVTSTAAELNILDGVTTTAAEINLIDGGTARESVTIVDADGILVNDGGTMKMVLASSLKTYAGGGSFNNFTLTADGGSNQTIADGNTLDIAGGNGITTAVGATDTVTVNVDAALTTVTSILATDLKIGEDDQTKIDFEDADTINFYAGNEKQLILTDGALTPGADNILDLGSSSVEFKDAYFDGTVTSDAFAGPLTGDVTGNADTATALATGRTIGMTGDVVWTSASFTGAGNVTGTSTIQANAIETAMIEDDAVTYAKIKNVTNATMLGNNAGSDGVVTEMTKANVLSFLNVADGADVTTFTLAGDGGSNQTITAGNTLTVAGGNGITTTGAATDTVSIAVDAAQTTITSIFATDLKIGEDDQTKIDFEDADKINFYAGNEKQLILEDGALYPGSDNIIDLGKSDNEFKDAYFDGTVTSDAFAGPLTGDVTGNADTATALATGRTIGMTGDVVWTSASFTGAGNVTGTATIQANSVDGTMIALGSDAEGDIMYYNGTNYIRLAKGTDNYVLTMNGNVPNWEAAGGGAVSAVANGSDNRIATFSSADALNGEANLTFDGTDLNIATGSIEVRTIDYSDGDNAMTIADGGGVTFAQPTTFSKATKPALEANSDGATVTFDLNEANVHTVTLGGNRTLAISNETAGQCFIIKLIQDGTGSRTVTWFSTIKWAGGTAPTLTTTADKADTFGFLCTGTDTYDGFVIGQNI